MRKCLCCILAVLISLICQQRSQANIYSVLITTGDFFGAGTDGDVYLTLYWIDGLYSQEIYLDNVDINDFERGNTDKFKINVPNTAPISHIKIRYVPMSFFDNTWYINKILVNDTINGIVNEISCQCWMGSIIQERTMSVYIPTTVRTIPTTITTVSTTVSSVPTTVSTVPTTINTVQTTDNTVQTTDNTVQTIANTVQTSIITDASTDGTFPTTISTTDHTISTVDEEINDECICDCQESVISKYDHLTEEEFLAEMEKQKQEIRNELLVNPKNVSKMIRKKISAPDDRKSSQSAGFIAAMLIFSLFLLVFISDFPFILKQLRITFKNKN